MTLVSVEWTLSTTQSESEWKFFKDVLIGELFYSRQSGLLLMKASKISALVVNSATPHTVTDFSSKAVVIPVTCIRRY